MYQPLERDIQVSFFDWLKTKQNQNDLWKNICCCPNGILKNAAAHVRLLREGFSPGFPDVMVMLPASGCHGLFIEFKRPGEKPTPNQIDWGRRLSAVGYCYRLCYSFEEAQALVKEYVGDGLQKLGVGFNKEGKKSI